MMTLQQASSWVVAAQLVGDNSVQIKRVHTDTRSLLPGDLFVALKGENFDANTLFSFRRIIVLTVAKSGVQKPLKRGESEKPNE